MNNKKIILALLAFLGLNACMVLPSWSGEILHQELSHLERWTFLFAFFWISADLMFLMILLILTRHAKYHKWVLQLCIVFFTLLWCYELYREGMIAGMNRKPLLINDFYLLIDSFYLILGMLPMYWMYAIPIVVFIMLLIWKIIPWLFRILDTGLQQVRTSFHTTIFVIIVLTCIGVSHQLKEVTAENAPIQFVAARFEQNIAASSELYQLHRRQRDNRVFRTKLSDDMERLSIQPNVYVFVIESYGKIVVDSPFMRNNYTFMMAAFEQELQSQGWYATTNYSRAPVSGGASWLSTLTMLGGEEIDNQLSYDFYTNFHIPDIITWFKQQGYITILLQPPTRKRPGLPVSNTYHFDRSILFDDLRYKGPEFGWGIIPDQYSLYVCFENYLQRFSQPSFFFFTMVSSHTPWSLKSLPPFIPNPISEQQLLGIYAESRESSQNELISRDKLRATDVLHSRYLAFIQYDLQVLVDFITHQLTHDDIVIIIGDHQPPVLTGNDSTYETPIHILSKDKGFIEKFMPFDFVKGLYKPADAEGSIAHNAIFHLLITTMLQSHGPS